MSPRMTKKFNAKFSYSTRHTQIVDRISKLPTGSFRVTKVSKRLNVNFQSSGYPSILSVHWIPPPLPPSLLPPFPTKNLHECCMSRFVVLAGRRHTRAPVVLSWFEIIKSTSVMNINGLWKCRPIILFSFHVSVVNRETLYVALGVKFGNSTLTCPPGLWRSNLTNDREPPNAGFTRFPSGSRLSFPIHCDNLSTISSKNVWELK